MIRKYLPVLLAAGAVWATLWAYSEITYLRGTQFWEFRFLVLLVGVFLVLSLVEFLLEKILPAPSGDQ